MKPSDESMRENTTRLAHHIAYQCGNCKARFTGWGDKTARYCNHCGVLLLAQPSADSGKNSGKKADRKKVLLVEDSQVLRGAFSRMIAELGHQVIEASNGKEALKALEEQMPVPDLIITDLHMPQMDGMELIEHLKKQERLRETPIIILTGDSQTEKIVQGLSHNVTDYIVKDIRRIAQIRERLKKFL